MKKLTRFMAVLLVCVSITAAVPGVARADVMPPNYQDALEELYDEYFDGDYYYDEYNVSPSILDMYLGKLMRYYYSRSEYSMAGEMIAEAMKAINWLYMGDGADVETLYIGAMRGMMAQLDPYSEYFTPWEMEAFYSYFAGDYYGIGVSLEMDELGRTRIKSFYNGSAALEAGLLEGDIIIAVDGEEAVRWDNGAGRLIDQSEDDVVVISVLRGDKALVFEVEKDFFEYNTLTMDTFDNVLASAKDEEAPNLRYIYISVIGENTAEELREAIAEAKAEGVTGIAIDLRGNGGGLMNTILDMCDQMVPKGNIASTLSKNGIATFYKSELDETPFENVVIITDNGTASACELFAAAMQDSKAATIVGEATYGKGVIQSAYELNAGDMIKLTTEEYFRRDGGKINGVGVKPDVKVSGPAMIYITDADMIGRSKAVLAELGYGEQSVGNVYDEAAMDAVTRFQKDHELPVTRALDAATVLALDYALYAQYYKTDEPLQKAYEILKNAS